MRDVTVDVMPRNEASCDLGVLPDSSQRRLGMTSKATRDERIHAENGLYFPTIVLITNYFTAAPPDRKSVV